MKFGNSSVVNHDSSTELGLKTGTKSEAKVRVHLVLSQSARHINNIHTTPS